MRQRSAEEKKTITGIMLYIGAHWPEEIIPEDDLFDAVNEFLRIPGYAELFQLIRAGDVKMHIVDRATHKREGCWLSFGTRRTS